MSKVIMPEYARLSLAALGASFTKAAGQLGEAAAATQDKFKEIEKCVPPLWTHRLDGSMGNFTFTESGFMYYLAQANRQGLPMSPPLGYDRHRVTVAKIVTDIMAGGEITQTMIDVIELCARRIKARVRANLSNVLHTIDLIKTDLAGVCGHSVNEFILAHWPKPRILSLDEYVRDAAFTEAMDLLVTKIGSALSLPP